MSADDAPPEPTPEHRRLEAFVGTWRTEGRVEAGPLGPAAALEGTDRYEWLPGGFYLVHHVDVRMGGEQVNTLEIIGWDPESRTYPMRWFDGWGASGTYHATFDDGVWRFAGETERFTGRFSDDGRTMTGAWERRDGSAWLPWMKIDLTKDSAGPSANGSDREREMSSGTAAGSTTADREIVLERVFDAPRELVFRAWTEAEHLPHWMGPHGFTITTHSIDVRVGGLWRYTMHGPDGTDYSNRVQYQEITRPERLVYLHGEDVDHDPGVFHVTVTFADEGGRTRQISRMVFPSAEARNMARQYGAEELGYQTMERLAAHLTTM